MDTMDDQIHPELMTIIGKGSELTADIASDHIVRIEGRVEGTISSSELVVVNETGKVLGKIDTKNAQISGRVHGDLVIQNLLQLTETAEISGNIFAANLLVADGALINGSVHVGKDVEYRPSNQSPELETKAEATPPPPPEEVKAAPEPIPEPPKKPLHRFSADVLIGIPDLKEGNPASMSIQKACGDFMNALGFSLDIFDDPTFNPFFQKFGYVLKTEDSKFNLSDAFASAKKTLEAAYMRQPGNGRNSKLYEAAAQLVQEIQKAENIAICLGEILIVQFLEKDVQTISIDKMTNSLVSKLKEKPTLITKPEDIFIQVKG